MRANSSVPTSAQTGVHEHLAALLERHRRSPFLKPYADYNRAAFAASMETAVAPLRQKLDEMDKRFAAAKPGAPVADTTGPADENTPLI